MAGTFSVGGLLSGLDTNTIISQLVQIERQPITRIQNQISQLETQRTAIRDLRTQLTTLYNRAQDFRLGTIFDQYQATSSSTSVLTAKISGTNPLIGSYAVQVNQLASATVAQSSAKLGSSINPAVALGSSGISTAVTAGTFTINGVQFNVDPTTTTLNQALTNINSSAAGVTATYDSGTDKITFTNTAGGDTSLINFGATGDTSNFLSAINVTGATQTTGGGGSTTVTSTRNLGAVNPSIALNTASFGGGAATSGTFKVNGISITVDVTTDTLNDVLNKINASDAGVSATYDTASDTIRFVSKTLGSRTINFTAGTSNFLTVTNLTAAVQTAGNDSQFTINGGPVQTRNTNDVTDAINGVTLSFLSNGTSTVTTSSDTAKVVEGVKSFITEFNASISKIRELVQKDGALENDGSIRLIQDFLRQSIFSTVPGITGSYSTLVDVGISTGSSFDATTLSPIELDEAAFNEALTTNPADVKQLFANIGKTGITDQIETYLKDVTSTTGFLNVRIKTEGTIDQQIEVANDRITRMEDRATKYEDRLRAQFTRLEQMYAGFSQQSTALSSLSTSGFTSAMLNR